jgi:hypothetical protein
MRFAAMAMAKMEEKTTALVTQVAPNSGHR